MPSEPVADSSAPRSSSMELEEDDDPPQSGSVLEAEVVLASTARNQNVGEEDWSAPESDEEEHRNTERLASEEKVDRKSSIDPLFATLYTALFCAIVFLIVALTRYIMFRRSIVAPTTLFVPEEAGTPELVSDMPEETNATPDQIPVASYRSNIEFVLSVELHEECSTNFFEGPQKMAIDWLIYEDQILNSTYVSEMAESRGVNGSGTSEYLVPAFPLVQRYVLTVLFFATGGELWSGEPWNEMVDVHDCKFMGVECDSEGQTTALSMGFRKLRGLLPNELGMLSKLTTFGVPSNRLEGSIPSFLYNRLTNLWFVDLSQNAFGSSISPDISKLSNLMGLYLSDLSLTGEIPIDDMKALTWLQFLTINSAPYLRGPILELLESLKYLKILDIHSSGFTGTIPTSIGENTLLQFLALDGVAMDGSNIPTEIGQLSNLKRFTFVTTSEGSGGGTIPTEIGNCRKLEHLKGAQLSGFIPTELGRLTNFESIWLSDGALTGSLPSEIGQLTKLNTLQLYNNQLGGSLPSEIGNLQVLRRFDIYSNNFTGGIPSGVCMSPDISIGRDCNVDECECCSQECSP